MRFLKHRFQICVKYLKKYQFLIIFQEKISFLGSIFEKQTEFRFDPNVSWWLELQAYERYVKVTSKNKKKILHVWDFSLLLYFDWIIFNIFDNFADEEMVLLICYFIYYSNKIKQQIKIWLNSSQTFQFDRLLLCWIVQNIL